VIYVNEIDPFCAKWIQNLMEAGVLPPGHIDTRSIEDVTPNDLAGYTQHHFFAGLGGWIYALDLAGWPRDRPVWTGSCPCQPFSQAGKGNGFEDERHLWPAWQHLIAQCRPAEILGEQVASKDADPWIDLVQADLEGMGYAFGCVPFPSAGVGAPHIRDRSYWCGRMVDSSGARLPERIGDRRIQREAIQPFSRQAAIGSGVVVRLGDTQLPAQERQRQHGGQVVSEQEAEGPGLPGSTGGFWRHVDWLPCADGKFRPVEPGTFPLLDGLPASLERLRSLEMAGWMEIVSYGNEHQADPEQVLRMVRERVQQEACRERSGPGVLQQLHAAPLLLDFLLCAETARDGAAHGGGGKKAGTEAQRRIVRSLLEDHGNSRAPRQWKPEGQPAGESTDPVLALSFVLARHAQAYRDEARKAHAASGRSGMLRGYGNAINPHQAAEFIRAYLEASGLIELERAA